MTCLLNALILLLQFCASAINLQPQLINSMMPNSEGEHSRLKKQVSLDTACASDTGKLLPCPISTAKNTRTSHIIIITASKIKAELIIMLIFILKLLSGSRKLKYFLTERKFLWPAQNPEIRIFISPILTRKH